MSTIQAYDPVLFGENTPREWLIAIIGNPDTSTRQLIEFYISQNEDKLTHGEYDVVPLDKLAGIQPPASVLLNSNGNRPGYYFINLPITTNTLYTFYPLGTEISIIENELQSFLKKHSKSTSVVPAVATGIAVWAIAKFLF